MFQYVLAGSGRLGLKISGLGLVRAQAVLSDLGLSGLLARIVTLRVGEGVHALLDHLLHVHDPRNTTE